MANINNACNQYSYPYYFAYGMSANQVNFPINTATKVLFDTKISDPNDVVVNGTLTIPMSGIWTLGAFLNVTGNAASSAQLYSLSLPSPINSLSLRLEDSPAAPSDPLEAALYRMITSDGSAFSEVWFDAGATGDLNLTWYSEFENMTILKDGAHKPTVIFGYLSQDIPVELR